MSAQRHILRILDGVSRLMPAKLSSAPTIANEQLDPFLHWLLAMRRSRGAAVMATLSAEEARGAFRQDMLPLRAGWKVGNTRDLKIGGAKDPLNARLYQPKQATNSLLVYFHGGGFVIGDVDTHDDICRLLCRESQTAVLSVDYRRAPEHPFPAPVEDAVAATRWAIGNLAEFGMTGSTVSIAGDSAGANLATVAARTLAEEGQMLTGQLLFYPGTDFVNSRESIKSFGNDLFLTASDRDWFYTKYLGDQDRADPRVSPLLAKSLNQLPPAIVVTAALDMLRDEGEAYALALKQHGTPTQLLRAKGLGHGFVNLTSIHKRSFKMARKAAIEFNKVINA